MKNLHAESLCPIYKNSLVMTTLRLQKYLSECGVCSRRHAEEAIKNGEVIVNGVPAQI